MDTTHFRQGNLINALAGDKDGDFDEVVAIADLLGDHIYHAPAGIDDGKHKKVAPVPLDLILMARCSGGFEYDSPNDDVIIRAVDRAYNEQRRITFARFKRPEFMHTFQNLVFALTGEEVKVASPIMEVNR